MSTCPRSSLLAGLAALFAGAGAASGQIVTFQQGLNGYTGAVDTEFRSVESVGSTNEDLGPIGMRPTISVDQNDGSTSDQNNRTQGAIRFDNLFGAGPGQIPTGASILFAEVVVAATSATDADAEISFNRVLGPDQPDPSDPVPRDRTPGPWREDDTWFSLGGSVIPVPNPENPDFLILPTDPIEVGPSLNLAVGNEALSASNEPGKTETYDGVLEPRFNRNDDEFTSIAVTASVRAWQAGAPNHGWAINNTTGNGWDFASSDFDVDAFPAGSNAVTNLLTDLGLSTAPEDLADSVIAARPMLRVVIGVAGDINLDGEIDSLDYDILRGNLGNENDARGVGGDVDFDFDVDLADFALFKSSVEALHGPGSFEAVILGVAPEPSAIALALLALGASGVRRRM